MDVVSGNTTPKVYMVILEAWEVIAHLICIFARIGANRIKKIDLATYFWLSLRFIPFCETWYFKLQIYHQKKKVVNSPPTLIFIISNKLGGISLNINKLNWIIGTQGNWKNQNPADLANLAQFEGKWARLAALFSW